MNGPSVRPLDAGVEAEVELVARRMHLTLAEVLDPTRADEMFTHAALVERVRWHLEGAPERRAAVFVAESAGGAIIGHTIVRVDDDDGPAGLFATTYVDPAHRRAGVASQLIEHGERWMRAEGVPRAITYTDTDNRELIELYRAHGYTIGPVNAEFVRATKPLR